MGCLVGVRKRLLPMAKLAQLSPAKAGDVINLLIRQFCGQLFRYRLDKSLPDGRRSVDDDGLGLLLFY